MTQEYINDLLHKEPGKTTGDEFPVCEICGKKFLGYAGDKICIE